MGYDFTLEEWMQTTGFQVEEYECELSEIPGIFPDFSALVNLDSGGKF